jgi:hypothetical protein
MTTTQKWHIVVLSAVVSYGSGLVAMDKKAETRSPLSCSIELRNELKRTPSIEIAALKHSAEKHKTEENTYYYDSPCGAGRNSSPEESRFYKQTMNVRMAPYSYFPGQ